MFLKCNFLLMRYQDQESYHFEFDYLVWSYLPYIYKDLFCLQFIFGVPFDLIQQLRKLYLCLIIHVVFLIIFMFVFMKQNILCFISKYLNLFMWGNFYFIIMSVNSFFPNIWILFMQTSYLTILVLFFHQ